MMAGGRINRVPGWADEFPGAVTVCDREGIILYMNNKAAATFAKWGGRDLVGRNLMDCHPEPARSKLRQLMEYQRSNVYTIEKQGRKKLIYQAPWYRQGRFMGLVEISLELPAEIPHFVRR
jgi:transcriptional regulator with PAS, ATPase and Fis domain